MAPETTATYRLNLFHWLPKSMGFNNAKVISHLEDPFRNGTPKKKTFGGAVSNQIAAKLDLELSSYGYGFLFPKGVAIYS